MNLRAFQQYLATTIVALSLSCCATDSVPYRGGDGGYLIASIGAQFDANFPNYKFKYRSLDRTYEGSISLPSHPERVVRGEDFKSPAKWGVVTVARLAPGSYEIYNYDISVGVRLSRGQDFSIPFTVRSGEPTYLGEYLAQTGLERDMLGIASARPPLAFVISNEQQRDIGLARSRFPEIANVPVTNAVPDPKNNPFSPGK
jgi:hypothetical protein